MFFSSKNLTLRQQTYSVLRSTWCRWWSRSYNSLRLTFIRYCCQFLTERWLLTETEVRGTTHSRKYTRMSPSNVTSSVTPGRLPNALYDGLLATERRNWRRGRILTKISCRKSRQTPSLSHEDASGLTEPGFRFSWEETEFNSSDTLLIYNAALQ